MDHRDQGPIRSYAVNYLCPECNQPHLVSGDYRIVAGPTEAGTLDDLYPGGDLPPELVALLGDLVWCDSRADWQDMDDPTLVHLTPHEKPRGL